MITTGNTILVTGGGSGIGRGLAAAFHALGNQVIIGGRRQAVLKETAAANPGMDYIVLDTTDTASIQAAATKIIGRFSALNVIINNAGVQRTHDFSQDKLFDEQAAAEEINTNIYGVLQTISTFLPHLKTKPAATIINVSSGLAFVPMARFPVYCATKAFVHSFSISLRHQLKGSHIDVIELAPPWVDTDLGGPQSSTPTHHGIGPMPLPAFIEAAMQELATDKSELPIAGAKFLHSSGVGENAVSTFEQINQ